MGIIVIIYKDSNMPLHSIRRATEKVGTGRHGLGHADVTEMLWKWRRA